MNVWQNLYFPCAQPDDTPLSVAELLAAALTSSGYTLYDPFALFSADAYTSAVRCFVSPLLTGADGAVWVRVCGQPDPALYPSLSRQRAFLLARLTDVDFSLTLWENGTEYPDVPALARYLRAGRTADDMMRAAQGALTSQRSRDQGLAAADLLPEEFHKLAGSVDMKQANKLFSRLSGTLAGKAGADSAEHAAAHELLRGASPRWDTPAAAGLSALIGCLRLPEAWRTPDFAMLRDAYALHRRRQRSPGAIMLAGDAEALAAVPDALDYIPVYGGKTA